MVKVTDPLKLTTVSEYDMAGRRTKVTQPASGTTIFKYDIGGNLIEKQTANLAKKNKKILYSYEFNRLKSITYPDHPENNITYLYGDNAAKDNCKGRLVCQVDGSGAQVFKYGKMGELTQIRRSLLIPYQSTVTYQTDWTYDSWNRVQTMTYPDGEVLKYQYDLGGQLARVTGSKGSDSTIYVDNILYDKYEKRIKMRYGNGVVTTNQYSDTTQNLMNLSAFSNKINRKIMNNSYAYDKVYNVIGVTNGATLPTSGIGGQMKHSYEYDGLYRLVSASGAYTGADKKSASYTLSMSYDNMGNILTKKQDVKQTGVQFDGNLKAGYDLSYSYVNNPQQISNIADVSYRYADGDSVPAQTKSQNWHYDANGNLLLVNTGVKNTDGKQQKQNERKLLWDEENRLLALSDNGNVNTYWYDAAGERTVKCSGENQSVYVNGALSGSNTSNTNFTAYINPYLVLNNGGYYSKHIYMGTERILSKLNSSDVFEYSPAVVPKADTTVDYTSKVNAMRTAMEQRYDSLGVIYIQPENGGEGLVTPESGRIKQPTPAYYYHSDHLGSSSLLTDNDGNVSQHIEYLPFGEVFVEERNNNWNTPYKFNAKELDEETGLYYYGARYFDSRTSVWYGVDPLGEKYPNMSSYVYCNNNPVKFIDPDGREKISFLPSKDPNTTAYVRFTDDKAIINIWVHGTPKTVNIYGEKRVNARILKEIIEKQSSILKNSKDKDVIIVLHSCETGNEKDGKSSIARELSKELEYATIFAPTENVVNNVNGEEIGTYSTTKNENGKLIKDKEGRWIEYKNGKVVGSQSGKSSPGSKGSRSTNSFFDKLYRWIAKFK